MTSTGNQPTVTDHEPVDADQADEQPMAAQGAESGVLAAALAAGAVTMHRVRRTGTLRHLPYLAPGTTAREEADWYGMRLDEGATVKDLAAEVGMRPLTVRRALWSLDLAEDIEDGSLDDLWDEYDPDETHQFVLQVSDHDYPYGQTPLTDPTNVGGHVVDEDGAE